MSRWYHLGVDKVVSLWYHYIEGDGNMTKLSDKEIIRIYHDEYLKGVSAYQLEEKYNLYKSYLYRCFKRLELPLRSNAINSKKYIFDERYFEEIDSANKAYWLGFIYADGYILSKRKQSNRVLGISLNIKDKKHLEKFNDCLRSNVEIKTYVESSGFGKGSQYCRVLYASQKLTDDLMKHGVYEHKSCILSKPDIPEEYIKDFIRGYFDGDGSIWKQDKGTQFNISIVGTDELLIFIQNHLLEIGIISRHYPLNKRKENQVVSNFKFGGNNLTYNFLHYLYEDSEIYLDRKMELYLELKNKINSHPIQ